MDNHRQEKWDKRFLDLAKEVSKWSKDNSTKVGAVIVENVNEIVSLGYNGFPKGDEDLEEDYNNREIKYKKIIHGEINSINFGLKNRKHLSGCVLYTYPFMSCKDCAPKVVDVGIKRVVSYQTDNPRWIESLEKSRQIFLDNEVQIVLYCKPEIKLMTPLNEPNDYMRL